MNHPKVSICIPTYKQVKYLQKTLDYIILQDYSDFELVITDDTPDYTVKQLIDTYDFKGKLNYYKNPIALGSPQNWNECISKANGEYIKIMHHDDWFSETFSLRKFVKALDDNPDVGFAFSRVNSINASINTEDQHIVSEDFLNKLKSNPSELFFGNLIGSPSVTIFRRNIHVSFDPKLKWVVDIDFYIQCLLKTKFSFINEVLVSSVNNAEHSVTNECINKEVEVFEYTYLYKKINTNNNFSERYVTFFKNLFKRYKINKKELITLIKGIEPDKTIRLALLKKKIGI